jgi:hypothetical protein
VGVIDDSYHLVVHGADVLLELGRRFGVHRFLAAARYSGTTPSTTSTLAFPRIDRLRAPSGVLPASIAGATSGRADSAANFGVVVAVETTAWSPVQKKPTGTTLGVPSIPT